MITKYLFLNRNENEQEANPMFTVRNMLPLLLVVLLLCGLSFGATKIVPTEYATIQAALNDTNAFDVIEVQSNADFAGNLVFPPNVSNPNDVNYLTLKAGTGFSPTITVSGVDANTKYIDIRSVGTILQGFTINFSGPAPTTDNNSAIVNASGGASAVRDCIIVGPTALPSSWIRGISGVAEINNVEVSQGRQGILCDANRIDTGFAYSITDSWIHDNYGWGVIFNDCDANVDRCVIEKSGRGSNWGEIANVVTAENTAPHYSLMLDLRITNSTIRDIASEAGAQSRNFRLQTKGTVTIEDCNTRGAKEDEILMYQGTLNLNRCILNHNSTPTTTGGCVAVVKDGTRQDGIVDINHCSLQGSDKSDAWVIWTQDPNAQVNIKNSILTGVNGYHTAATLTTGYFISNYNDNDCNVAISGPAITSGVVPGLYDLRQTGGPRFNPFYIQTANSDVNTYFALQPYSPVIRKGEFDSNMGARGVIYGFEKWPGDFDDDGGVDKDDLQIFHEDWIKDSNVIPTLPDPNLLLESFESKTAIPDVNCSYPGWPGAAWPGYIYPAPADANYAVQGTSTVSLLTSGVYDGSKALRWVYDVNRFQPGASDGEFTEVIVDLPDILFNTPVPGTIDINVLPPLSNPKGQASCVYNQLKVMVRRDATNSPNTETFMYVKFLNIAQSSPVNSYSQYDIVAYIVGGSTEPNTADAGKWVPWTIPLTINNNTTSNLTVTTSFRHRLTRVTAIAFGVRDQLNGPWGKGAGTIDIDKIELIDQVGCSGLAAGDFNRDCIENFRDYVTFAKYWLEGKL